MRKTADKFFRHAGLAGSILVHAFFATLYVAGVTWGPRIRHAPIPVEGIPIEIIKSSDLPISPLIPEEAEVIPIPPPSLYGRSGPGVGEDERRQTAPPPASAPASPAMAPPTTQPQGIQRETIIAVPRAPLAVYPSDPGATAKLIFGQPPSQAPPNQTAVPRTQPSATPYAPGTSSAFSAGIGDIWLNAVKAQIGPINERVRNMPNVKLPAAYYLLVDEKGRILATDVKVSSGNGDYDRLMMQYIRQASPVTPPPPGVRTPIRLTLEVVEYGIQ